MVLENNIADRHMKTNIISPKIVVVEGSLTLDSSSSAFVDIESILRQENHIIKWIERWLMTASPNIIVYEHEVSRKIVERLRDIGYTVIMNVPKEDLKRLAWLTQTIVIPSIEFIDDNFKWGTWEEFIVQAQLDENQYNSSYYHTKYNSYFRGCNPWLGWTVCFTGSDDLQLEKVKECFISILDQWKEELLGKGFETKNYSLNKSRLSITESEILSSSPALFSKINSMNGFISRAKLEMSG